MRVTLFLVRLNVYAYSFKNTLEVLKGGISPLIFFGVFPHLQSKMPHPIPLAERNEEHGDYVV